MADKAQWEYRVLTVGSFWGTDNKLLETRLNELGQDGWEVISALPHGPSTAAVTIVAKRPLSAVVRRRRERDAIGER